MNWLTEAARLADRVVETLIRDANDAPYFDTLVIRDTVCGVPLFLGVLDVDPVDADEIEPHWSAGDAWFNGWSDMVERMQEAHDDHVHNNRPSLRLVIPSDALVGGIRPHDKPGQPFRLDWLVGAAMVDRSARLLWQHGRELLPLLTRSAIVPGSSRRPQPRGAALPPGAEAFVSWCSTSNVAIGFGGVDVAVWSLAGVRDPRRLLFDTADGGVLSEVVELSDVELYGCGPNELGPPTPGPHGPGGIVR